MGGMICAPQPYAVEAGARVLAAGGNAFDAAVACAWVQFVVDPHSCGIGGYLLLTAMTPEGIQPVLDAPATAGAKTSPEMWEHLVLGPNPSGWGYFLRGKVNEDGYQSICTPGTIRGLETIHRRWCTRPWAELITPAADLAEGGWMLGQNLAQRWLAPANFYEGSSLFEKLQVSEDARRIYLRPNGEPRRMGETLRNPDQAEIMHRIARHGADEFYEGDLAANLTSDLAQHGSSVTAEDFRSYGILDQAPVRTTYRGYEVISAGAPHGGTTLCAILNILSRYPLGRLGHNSPEYLHLVAMAMKAAFSDRNRYLGDPRFGDVRESWMLSSERADEWCGVIDRGEPISTARVQPGSQSTTQVTVVDDRGNWVSLTHSLGSSSGVITPGTGFMWNNSMINFHPVAGHPNSIAPGKARTTGMAPTLVLKDGVPLLALGAPGATRILTSVLQVILNILDFGMGVQEAVLAPRIDCQGDTIDAQLRIPEYVCEEVRKKHPIRRIPISHGGMGLVHAVARDAATGRYSGGADTGHEGMALLV